MNHLGQTKRPIRCKLSTVALQHIDLRNRAHVSKAFVSETQNRVLRFTALLGFSYLCKLLDDVASGFNVLVTSLYVMGGNPYSPKRNRNFW